MSLDLDSLIDLVKQELHESLSRQLPNGSFQNGHNGPYSDAETCIRNTSHLMLALCAMYEKTGDERFYISAERALKYLLDNKHIGENGAYVCRISEGKDETNGVIGHAWIIEALLKAQNVIDSNVKSVAEKIWQLHHFDYSLGIWAKPVSIANSYIFDHTFNHQLWFAACIAPLALPEVDNQIKCFISKNLTRLNRYENGVIYHLSPVGDNISWLRNDFLLGLRKILSPLKNRHQKRDMYLHSASYHTFNLYALAMLKELGYGRELDAVLDTESLLKVLRNEDLKEDLLKLPDIGIRYNPSGIEAAYALKILGGESDEMAIKSWVDFQIKQTGSEAGILVGSSPDKATSAARVYEAMRLF